MEYQSLFLVLVGYGCYKLGVGGSLVWLALCGVAFMWVKGANAGGGCDGGLCILPYVFTDVTHHLLPFIEKSICIDCQSLFPVN